MENQKLIKVLLPDENGGLNQGILTIDYYIPITSIAIVEKFNDDYLRVYITKSTIDILQAKNENLKKRGYVFVHRSLFQILEERQL